MIIMIMQAIICPPLPQGAFPPEGTTPDQDGSGAQNRGDGLGSGQNAAQTGCISAGASLRTLPTALETGYAASAASGHGRRSACTWSAAVAPLRGSKPEPPKIPSADQRGLSRARSMG